jgi:hypothetical protein
MQPKFEERSQRYHFDCERCGSAWTRDYEIREARDPEGEEYELFLLDGMPVTPPRAGVDCPNCGHDHVVGHHEPSKAPAPAAAPRPRAHRIAGAPLIVLSREPVPGGRERIRLSVGTTRLILEHGLGGLPEQVRARVESPTPVHVAGTEGRYGAAHWTDGQARLVWERDGRWFELSGHAGHELLVATANELMGDLVGLGIVAR